MGIDARPAAIGAATLAAMFGAWEILSVLDRLNPFFFPAPSRLAVSLYELVVDGYPDGIRIQTHIAITLQRVLTGFIGSALIAVPLGIVIGSVPVLDRLTRHVFTFGRSIAAISLLPLFIAWFGIGELSKIMLIGLGSFWIVVSYTVAGVKFVDPILLRAARSIDTPRARIFSHVILPAALPRIFNGLKVALGVAFMIIVAAEMIATVRGLGSLIQEARTSFRTDITMVGMLVIGAIGFALSHLLDWAERRLLPWRMAAEER